MTITLDLAPDIEEGLLAQAEAKGVSIRDYVEEIVEKQARQGTPVTPNVGSRATNLHEFFLHSPLRGASLDLERNKDHPRSVEIE